MATLHVTDSVVIAQNPALVWNVLIDFDSYAKWWPQSVRIRVLKTTPELIGSQFEVRPFGGSLQDLACTSGNEGGKEGRS